MTCQEINIPNPTIQIHVCHMTDWEMEMGCSQSSMDAQQEEYRISHYEALDQSEDSRLVSEYPSEDQNSLDDAWPWWLDQQWDVQDPEIIDV